ncbi:MAG: GatB/YqeY domain-containing protein [Parcubacteria group bacterium]|nr:GatB/YqeY domain-containing protein [Parcubacteria group bacterium]
MHFHIKVKSDITEAMRAKDQLRLSFARNLLAAFVNELVAKRQKPDGVLSDEDALSVIRRLAKQRRDSIEQFEAGGRKDLAEKERSELAYLEAYLPQMMSVEEVRAVVEKKKAELGVSAKSDMGKLMSAAMSELKGKADGAVVKEVVASLLS